MSSRWMALGVGLALLSAACSPDSAAEDSSVPEPTAGPSTSHLEQPTTTSTTPPRSVSAPPQDGREELATGGPIPAGAPEAVVNREPLPYCGAAMRFPSGGVNPFPDIQTVAGADACYVARASSGLPAELITVGFTIEGDPILSIRRLLPDGREEFFTDMTRDKFGSMSWIHVVCASYLPPGSEVENCQPQSELPVP